MVACRVARAALPLSRGLNSSLRLSLRTQSRIVTGTEQGEKVRKHAPWFLAHRKEKPWPARTAVRWPSAGIVSSPALSRAC